MSDLITNTNVNHPDYANVDERLKDYVKSLKRDVFINRSISQIFYDQPRDRVDDEGDTIKPGECKHILESPYAKDVVLPYIKAFGTESVGEGQEWLATAVANTYIDEYRIDSNIFQKLPQITMPTKKYEHPISKRTIATRSKEGRRAKASTFGTGVIEFIARKFEKFFRIPEELTEDAAPDVLSKADMELTLSHLSAYDDCLVNGKLFATGETHIDSDVTDEDDARYSFDGLRRRAIQNAQLGLTLDFSGSAPTEILIRQIRARLGRLGVRPSELLWIGGPQISSRLQGLDIFSTIDKYGIQATNTTGLLERMLGIDFILSDFFREDLNASGVYDGTTTDKSGLILLNKTRWMSAVRRPIRKILRPPTSDYDGREIASYSRVDFNGYPLSASETSLVYAFNMATGNTGGVTPTNSSGMTDSSAPGDTTTPATPQGMSPLSRFLNRGR